MSNIASKFNAEWGIDLRGGKICWPLTKCFPSEQTSRTVAFVIKAVIYKVKDLKRLPFAQSLIKTRLFFPSHLQPVRGQFLP